LNLGAACWLCPDAKPICHPGMALPLRFAPCCRDPFPGQGITWPGGKIGGAALPRKPAAVMAWQRRRLQSVDPHALFLGGSCGACEIEVNGACGYAPASAGASGPQACPGGVSRQRSLLAERAAVAGSAEFSHAQQHGTVVGRPAPGPGLIEKLFLLELAAGSGPAGRAASDEARLQRRQAGPAPARCGNAPAPPAPAAAWVGRSTPSDRPDQATARAAFRARRLPPPAFMAAFDAQHMQRLAPGHAKPFALADGEVLGWPSWLAENRAIGQADFALTGRQVAIEERLHRAVMRRLMPEFLGFLAWRRCAARKAVRLQPGCRPC